jgi:hypothetical protein
MPSIKAKKTGGRPLIVKKAARSYLADRDAGGEQKARCGREEAQALEGVARRRAGERPVNGRPREAAAEDRDYEAKEAAIPAADARIADA